MWFWSFPVVPLRCTIFIDTVAHREQESAVYAKPAWKIRQLGNLLLSELPENKNGFIRDEKTNYFAPAVQWIPRAYRLSAYLWHYSCKQSIRGSFCDPVRPTVVYDGGTVGVETEVQFPLYVNLQESDLWNRGTEKLKKSLGQLCQAYFIYCIFLNAWIINIATPPTPAWDSGFETMLIARRFYKRHCISHKLYNHIYQWVLVLWVSWLCLYLSYILGPSLYTKLVTKSL